jgi:Spy/CpxP family protein refolding chaperone
MQKITTEGIVRALLTASLLIFSASAYSTAPAEALAMFKLQNDQPIEFVAHSSDPCQKGAEFKHHEQEQASNDLMMGVMLAARESGMHLEVIEEETCLRR